MDHPQWEYCQLNLYGVDSPEVFYLQIKYMGASHGTHVLSQGGRGAKKWDFNPFLMAMGRLGLAGWEMISVHHTADAAKFGTLGIAYFKRPVVTGRRVDAPALTLE